MEIPPLVATRSRIGTTKSNVELASVCHMSTRRTIPCDERPKSVYLAVKLPITEFLFSVDSVPWTRRIGLLTASTNSGENNNPYNRLRKRRDESAESLSLGATTTMRLKRRERRLAGVGAGKPATPCFAVASDGASRLALQSPLRPSRIARCMPIRPRPKHMQFSIFPTFPPGAGTGSARLRS